MHTDSAFMDLILGSIPLANCPSTTRVFCPSGQAVPIGFKSSKENPCEVSGDLCAG